MTERFGLQRFAIACLLASPLACAAPHANARPTATPSDSGRPRVELLAPCAAAARDAVPCTHRHPVLEVSY